jgi:hypothetical protein
MPLRVSIDIMLPDAGIALVALIFAASASVALLIIFRHVLHGSALRLVVIDPSLRLVLCDHLGHTLHGEKRTVKTELYPPCVIQEKRMPKCVCLFGHDPQWLHTASAASAASSVNIVTGGSPCSRRGITASGQRRRSTSSTPRLDPPPGAIPSPGPNVPLVIVLRPRIAWSGRQKEVDAKWYSTPLTP